MGVADVKENVLVRGTLGFVGGGGIVLRIETFRFLGEAEGLAIGTGGDGSGYPPDGRFNERCGGDAGIEVLDDRETANVARHAVGNVHKREIHMVVKVYESKDRRAVWVGPESRLGEIDGVHLMLVAEKEQFAVLLVEG